MIIKRDDELEDEVLLSLRYYFENEIGMEKCYSEFSNAILNNTINKHYPNKWASTYRLVIDDLDLVNIDANLFLDIHRRLGLVDKDFDFFLGITSPYQTGGFCVPPKVTELIRVLGGSIEVSYVTYDLG